MIENIVLFERARQALGYADAISVVALSRLAREQREQGSWAACLDAYWKTYNELRLSDKKLSLIFNQNRRSILSHDSSDHLRLELDEDGLRLTSHSSALNRKSGKHVAVWWLLDSEARISGSGHIDMRVALEAFTRLVLLGMDDADVANLALRSKINIEPAEYNEFLRQVMPALFIVDTTFESMTPYREPLVEICKTRMSSQFAAMRGTTMDLEAVRESMRLLMRPAGFFSD